VYLKKFLLFLITITLLCSTAFALVNDKVIQAEQDMVFDEIVSPVSSKHIDFDNDRKLDLVRKESNGQVYVYLNTGTSVKPVYTNGILYKGPEIVFDEVNEPLIMTSETWEIFYFNRFDLYIESDYYNSNSVELNEFFVLFEQRLNFLEDFTHWNSETSFNQKLMVIVRGTTGCYGGGGGNGSASLFFSDPLYKSSCQQPIWINGNPLWNNPTELGDNWRYMGVAMHESTHGINPEPVFKRKWLTEGFARYNEYNILSLYGDIPQETSNHYIFQGDSYYNWADYTENDYYDTSPEENEIQSSNGYSITAWMFSLLRDEHELNFENFFDLMENNSESLDKSFELGGSGSDSFFTDMTVIDLFGRALNLDFESQTKPIFRYDSITGPGYGVRNWIGLNWYADLTPSINVSDSFVYPGKDIQITSVIYNNGSTDADNVNARIYFGSDLVHEQTINLPANSNTQISAIISSSVPVSKTVSVVIDEDNLKLESNELNNSASASVSFVRDCTPYFDKRLWKWVYPCRMLNLQTNLANAS